MLIARVFLEGSSRNVFQGGQEHTLSSHVFALEKSTMWPEPINMKMDVPKPSGPDVISLCLCYLWHNWLRGKGKKWTFHVLFPFHFSLNAKLPFWQRAPVSLNFIIWLSIPKSEKPEDDDMKMCLSWDNWEAGRWADTITACCSFPNSRFGWTDLFR